MMTAQRAERHEQCTHHNARQRPIAGFWPPTMTWSPCLQVRLKPASHSLHDSTSRLRGAADAFDLFFRRRVEDGKFFNGATDQHSQEGFVPADLVHVGF